MIKSLINNVIARICLVCPITIASEDSEVTELFLAFLDKPWKSVDIEYYAVTITTPDDEILEFWNANKYYGWADKGSIKSRKGRKHWKGQRPSMYAMYLMVKRIERFGKTEDQRLSSVLL